MVSLKENISLKNFNTFGIDVKAALFFEVTSINDLKEILSKEQYISAPKLILGGGSNILFTKDFGGMVIHNCIHGIEILSENNDYALVKCGGGVNWHQFVLFSIEKNLGGIENLSLIPGNVGASPIQNIGAYGVEITDSFHSLEAVDLSNGEVRVFSKEECQFGYRDSIFKREQKGKYLIASVTFKLSKKPQMHLEYGAIKDELKKNGIKDPSIRDVSNAVIAIRKSKLPDPTVLGNAGSFFKNPEIELKDFEELKNKHPDAIAYSGQNGKMKIAAGWLIETCGWKGKKIGNVGMHTMQALVLVNYGNATGSELINHARLVQSDVLQKTGINLEMEVNII